MNIKLIALDVDGTLMSSRNELLPSTVEALQAAADRGIHIVLCTGRMLSECGELLEQLQRTFSAGCVDFTAQREQIDEAAAMCDEALLDNFLEIHWIANAFRGIKIGVGLLILNVAITMVKKMKAKPLPRILAGSAFAMMLAVNFLSLKFSSITLMLIAGAVGLAVFLADKEKGGGAK